MPRTSSNAWSLEEFKSFLETYPLYVKLRIRLPLGFHAMIPQTLNVHCGICRGLRTFRDDGTAQQPKVQDDQKAAEGYVRERERQRLIAAQPGDSRSRGSGRDYLEVPAPVGIYGITFKCVECLKGQFLCWLDVPVSGGYVRKVGQFPMWLAELPKELAQALGDDAEFYQKALRNMREGYGIGACAYLRRLLERYINPLLELLYEVKKHQGASESELQRVKDAIAAKDFTTKTKYASEIAPTSILVDGYNPLKEIHERLSIGIHLLDEETANEYALVISEALAFIIPALKQQLKGREAFAEKLKEIRKLKVK